MPDCTRRRQFVYSKAALFAAVVAFASCSSSGQHATTGGTSTSGSGAASQGGLSPSGPNAQYMHFNGRVDASSPGGILMAWPGTSFSVRTTGASRVTATLRPHQYGENNVMSAYVDGQLAATATISSGPINMNVPVSSGDHTVAFVKRTEAGNGGVLVGNVVTDGHFEMLNATPQRLIEVVGENAATGASVDGPAGTTTCTQPADSVSDPNNQNAAHTFGMLLAQQFNADYGIVAASSRGVVQNYDGSLGGTMPALYRLAVPTDANSVWTSPTSADVVIVNLGTNDVNYWLYNATAGAVANQSGFVAAYASLLKQIRQQHPAAYIIATVGPTLTNGQCINSATGNGACTGATGELPILSTVQGMVQQAVGQAADSKTSTLNFKPNSTDVSCNYLPDVAGHQALATQLAGAIAQLTGWQPGSGAVTQPAATGKGPQTLPGPTSTWPDPLANDADPNATGIVPGQYPECHYCSPQPFNANAQSCAGAAVLGVSQPCEGYCHVPETFNEVHGTNPPVSGNHFAEPAVVGDYPTAVPRGHLIHSMEHGAIIMAYNCPDGCDADLATMRATVAALTNQPQSDAWVILTPDPLLPTPYALMSWTYIYTPPSPLDGSNLRCFIDQHAFYGRECLGGHSPSYCPALLAQPMSSSGP